MQAIRGRVHDFVLQPRISLRPHLSLGTPSKSPSPSALVSGLGYPSAPWDREVQTITLESRDNFGNKQHCHALKRLLVWATVMYSPFRLLVVASLILGVAGVDVAAQREAVTTAPKEFIESIRQLVAQDPSIAKETYRSIPQLDEQGRLELKSRGAYPKLVRGDPKLKTVALTFDDGPYADYTPRLLAVLKRAGVKATFFNIGYKVDKLASLVRAEAQQGEVANHTYDHIRLPTISDYSKVEGELRYGSQAIQKALGSKKAPDICRPAGGEYDDDVVKAAKKDKYTMALWTDDPGDYLNPGASVIESRLLRDLSPGAIILLHDSVEQTLQCLPDFILKAQQQGYKFVTCSELMAQKGAIRSGGPNTYTKK